MSDQIRSAVLRDGEVAVTVLSQGCAVQDWTVGDRRVVLGFQDVESYLGAPASMGVIVGRVANRIAGGRFELDGERFELPLNNGENHLHGGPEGLGRQAWDLEVESPKSVVLRHHSPDGAMGYPGAVDFAIRLSLSGHSLTWDMQAVTDRPTPVALAQHLYFNLAGKGLVKDHRVWLRADRYTPTGPSNIPTGALPEVTETRFDFRQARRFDEADPKDQGYDHNLVLSAGEGPVAEVTSPDGMRLRLWTDQPGLQLYSGTGLKPGATPLGPEHQPWAGFCLEAQAFPDTVNQPDFGSVRITPEAPYRQVTTIEIAPS